MNIDWKFNLDEAPSGKPALLLLLDGSVQEVIVDDPDGDSSFMDEAIAWAPYQEGYPENITQAELMAVRDLRNELY